MKSVSGTSRKRSRYTNEPGRRNAGRRLATAFMLGTILTPSVIYGGLLRAQTATSSQSEVMSFGGNIPRGNIRTGNQGAGKVTGPDTGVDSASSSSPANAGSKVTESATGSTQPANPYADFSTADDAPIIRPGMPDIRPEKSMGPDGMDFFAGERQHEKQARSLGTAQQLIMNEPTPTSQGQIETGSQAQQRVNEKAEQASRQRGSQTNPFSGTTSFGGNNQSGNMTSDSMTATTSTPNSVQSQNSQDDRITLTRDAGNPDITHEARNPSDRGGVADSRENQRLWRALRREFPNNYQIRTIRNEAYRTKGEEVSPYTSQTPVKRTVGVSLDPGSEIPPIHLSYGIATPITFNDISGQPWDVSYAVWDKNQFDVHGYEQSVVTGTETDKDGRTVNKTSVSSTNTLIIVPKTQGAISGRNLVVLLKGAKTPVNFLLDQGRGPTYDAQVYASVQGRGPNAKQDYVQDMVAPSNDSEMQGFIDGTPPKGAHKRRTDNPSVEAWTYNHMLYIRTSGEVYAPGPQKRATSSLYGVGVFAVSDSPAVTVSFDGELSVVRID